MDTESRDGRGHLVDLQARIAETEEELAKTVSHLEGRDLEILELRSALGDMVDHCPSCGGSGNGDLIGSGPLWCTYCNPARKVLWPPDGRKPR